MKKIIFIIFISLSVFSCKSQQIDKNLIAESRSLIIKIFDDFSNTAYYKDKNISNNILFNPSIADYNSWSELILKSHLILQKAKSYNTKTKEYKTDYYKIFNEREVHYMSKQASNIKAKTWEEYLKIRPNRSKKDDIVNANTFVSKTFFLSIPVFSIDNNFALIYQENRYGGDIRIYQKIKGKWESVSSAGVWID